MLFIVYVVSAAHAAGVIDQSTMDIVRAACTEDARKLCSGVQPGGGRILACLKEHKDQLSANCQQAAARITAQSGSPVASDSSAPPGSSTSAATSVSSSVEAQIAASGAFTAKQPVAAKLAHPSSATPGTATQKTGAPSSYLLMKQVKVIDPGMDKVQAPLAAYDLLLPADWQFTGTVVFGGGKGGCLADLFGLVITATSADGLTKFQTAPDYTWQYADDPAVMKSLTDPNRRVLGSSAKTCQVAKPMKAEEYFRRNVITLFPRGAEVLSVEPFPELNELVRKRQGLPPGDGSSTGSIRTEAIRARLAFTKDSKDWEEWVGLVVVTKISPVGRGSFYDSHAMSLVALTSPKGKLDASDKLFKVIVSSIRPESPWIAYSNGVLKKLYEAEAQKNAAIDKIYSDLQKLAISDLNEVTANRQHGSTVSAMQTDQNIRNVQTFRDPNTGHTMELSNLYDNAWYNSASHQYVLSDDPNFKASGALSGNWTELQVVRPSP
ncbi:MAG: cysteine rich repeat-containing protein [Pseudomonadota bacterium]|nr:cysteine rich repeat-containing protein [Pseudomonadota bacterium]